jgi:hypothetical protein
MSSSVVSFRPDGADSQPTQGLKVCIPIFIGFLIACGGYGPFLGRAFSFFGIHVRVASCFLGGAGIVLAFLSHRRAKIERWAFLTIVLLFALVGLQSNSTQWTNLFTPAFDTEYESYKLAAFVQFGLPLIAMGLAANANRDDWRFQAGLCAGMLFLGAVACLYGLVNHELFFARTYETVNELLAAQTVSTIGFSILVTSAFCILSMLRPSGTVGGPLRLLCLAVLFAFIVTLQQRTHLIVAVVVFLLMMRTQRLTALITVMMIGGALAVFWPYVVGESVAQYWLSLFGGTPFEGRAGLFTTCIGDLLASPAGHGLGSFAGLQLEVNYPHNAIAEAAYELGAPGAALVLLILVLALVKIAPLIIRPSDRSLDAPMRAVLLLNVIHSMKSGDLTDFLTVLFVYLCCPSRYALLGRQTGIYRRFKAEQKSDPGALRTANHACIGRMSQC